MPFYIYTNQKGMTVERQFPIGQAPASICIDRQGVFKRDSFAEMKTQVRRVKDGDPVREKRDGKIRSNAMGVHPSQIGQARSDAARKRLKVDFEPDGTAVFNTRKQRNAYAEAHGLYDLNGGYGDAQRSKKHLNYKE